MTAKCLGLGISQTILAGMPLSFAILLIAVVACTAATPQPEFAEDRKNLLEHCGVPGEVRRAIERNMRDPDSFQWFRTVGARPSEESLVWGSADSNGESQFLALVRGINGVGVLVESRWGGVIDRDSCAVTSLGAL